LYDDSSPLCPPLLDIDRRPASASVRPLRLLLLLLYSLLHIDFFFIYDVLTARRPHAHDETQHLASLVPSNNVTTVISTLLLLHRWAARHPNRLSSRSKTNTFAHARRHKYE
jgi:hypothetical protein